jgi:hypothetical protein
MTQAIRQTIFVQSDDRLEIHSDQLFPGRKVEVIIILEDDPAISSAEALAIKRLENLGLFRTCHVKLKKKQTIIADQ